MSHFIARFLKDESGATAIEYGLIAALVSLSIVTGATYIGQQLNSTYNNIATELMNAA